MNTSRERKIATTSRAQGKLTAGTTIIENVGGPVRLSDIEKSQILRKMQDDIEKLPRYHITKTSISVMSFEQMEKLKVCDITSSELSGPSSVNDERLGSVDDSTRCSSCFTINCVGHYGLIRFREYIYNPFYLRQVVAVLNCVCQCCCCLLLNKNTIYNNNIHLYALSTRLKFMEKASLGLSCKRNTEGTCSVGLHGNNLGSCMEEGEILPCKKNPKYTAQGKEEGVIFYKCTKDSQAQAIPISDVYKIINKISDKDAKLLGFGKHSHPRNLILKGILLLPISARPPKKRGGILIQANITNKYANIVGDVNKLNSQLDDIKRNQDKLARIRENRIRRYIGQGYLRENAERQVITDLSTSIKYQRYIRKVNEIEANKQMIYKKLWFEIRTLFEKADKFGNKFGGDVLSLGKQLQGKEGLIRNMLMGKTSKQCGRTVITPDPSLRFEQISIPFVMTEVLTTTERAFAPMTPSGQSVGNLPYLQELLEKGEILYIVKMKGPMKGILNPVNPRSRIPYVIEVGDVVHRRIRDGDIILSNRHPTLHHSSIMAFEVVLSNRLSIGLHPSHTTPLNADHDGDEMNVWVLQDLEAKAEAKVLMTPASCLTSTENAGMYMGLVMDAVYGAYVMTDKYTDIIPEIYYSCISLITYTSDFPSLPDRLKEYGVPMLSGRGLFSTLLPVGFHYERGDVRITNGVLVRGRIKKAHIGPSPRSIIQEIWKIFGKDRAATFITDANYLLMHYTTVEGFTIGIAECAPERGAVRREQLIQEKLESTREIVEVLQSTNITSELEKNYIEKQILGATKGVQAFSAKMVKETMQPRNPIIRRKGEKLKYNTLLNMVESGSKGSLMNVAQMSGMVGQQIINDERIKPTITYGTRSLPTQSRGDSSIEAAGYCVNSYQKGSTPEEIFLQLTSGRLQLMDSSTKVPIIGDIQRKADQSLKDLTIWYDGSVRNTNGIIYQFIYSDLGFAVDSLHRVDTPGYRKLNGPIDILSTVNRLNTNYEYENKLRK